MQAINAVVHEIDHRYAQMSKVLHPACLQEASGTELKALPFEVEAVIAGAETGVELADALSEKLELRTEFSRRQFGVGARNVVQLVRDDLGAARSTFAKSDSDV